MNKQQIYNQILQEQREHEQLEKQRRDSAYATALLDETFAKLDSEVRRLTSEIGRGVKPKSKEAELTKALKIATDKRDKVFAKYYKPTTTPKADINKELRSRLLLASGLGNAQSGDFKSVPTGLEKSYTSLSIFATKFPATKKPNIIISGPTGTGKTYAVQTLSKALVDKSHSVLYVTAFSMVKRFKDYIFERNFSALDDMLECDVLIIDDLGTEPVIRNITDEYLYNLINERYVKNKSFIITTNLDKEMMTERYGDRIASRVFAKDTTAEIKLTGIDLRSK